MMTLQEAIERVQAIRDKAADQAETENDAEALNIAIDCMLSVEAGDM